ncbi:similar to Saccharomyces cerevisiae YDR464W SPP41 Protein involved in negative regulation of expression of spliceosome components PRP4 and PRP3 [Maudiozyma saulgeensis]|uniref:Similar to Saccharomyces cerevisiae YDR464W SPP41 Protein involved in negative regulation of expression of spliceosome components PRP4 and PRP3 n=1 Tax=Maudiozyma saulgeensis TaxID=1789683 RepID=A0A1X7R9V8_9SACH|nr:similar to Saccharomyces cerevisiae YDR464W SPP41 Protein involved in negative regulation of expression of spliceosome components PRP4 and PRP3 [Kazachstania saulgeensis]
MSDNNREEEHDFSFNELIDNILTNDTDDKGDDVNHEDHDISSNKEHEKMTNSITAEQDDIEMDDVHNNSQSVPNHSDHDDNDELPDFEAEDLVNAVASAMQDIETDEKDGDEHNDNNNRDENNANNNEPAPNPQHDEDDEAQQHSEWARILQEGLMQDDDEHGVHSDEDRIVETHDLHDDTELGTDNIQHTIDQLDRDDENLRLAILESLQNLEETGEQPQTETKNAHDISETKEESTKKAVAKKTSKKKKKEKSKDKSVQKEKGSPKKKKTVKHKKNKDKSKDKADDLNFNDVIEGLIGEDKSTEGKTKSTTGATEENDDDARAIVEETLKAFERELLGSSTEPTTKTTKKERTKKTKTSQKHTQKDKVASINKSTKTESKKKKKKKASKKTDKSAEDEYKEDDFSKALVDMVNQVVSTSLGDESTASKQEATNKDGSKPHSISIPTWNHTQITPYQDESRAEITTTPAADEPFDLNQIMQNAMAMAFQEQNDDNFDPTVMEEFNKSLGSFNVSDLLSTGQTTTKKKPAKKKAPKKKKPVKPKAAKERKIVLQKVVEKKKKKPKQPKKPVKPKKSPEQILRKKYKAIVTEAANVAKKRSRMKRRETRAKLLEDKIKHRAEKKQLKSAQDEKRLIELKELEEIVAKGPPYPIDLRVTKKGVPKKPYRRWTAVEMEKRAQMVQEKPKKPAKVKKEKKKKAKKLKRVPLKTLRKIPLFNTVKGSPVPSKLLNDIEGTLSKIQLPQVSIDPTASKYGINLSSKTVVFKEKIPFHPPWCVPLHPPYILPVARRRPKDNKYSTEHKREKAKKVNELLNDTVLRNEILPRTLATVITTLKAAAKARIGNGASPEQTLKYLRIIIERTKRSIAQAISKRNSEEIRNQEIKQEQSNTISTKATGTVRKIPLFTLSNIKKIEKDAISSESQKIGPTHIVVKEEPINQLANVKVEPHSKNGDSILQVVENVSESPDVIMNTGSHDDQDTKTDHPDEMLTKEKKYQSATDVELRALFLRGALLGGEFDIKGYESKKTLQNTEAPPMNYIKEVIEIKDEENYLINARLEQPVKKLSPILNTIIPAKRKFIKVEDMVESLVNHELETNGGNSHLSPGLSKIITSTISGILPKVKKEKKNTLKSTPARTPVLNLDGLVPPKSFTMSQTATGKPIEVSPISRLPIAKISKPKVETVSLHTYSFNLPDFSDFPGKKNILMRKARNLLNPEELKVLNREMSRERKKRWREANAQKNWEIDYKARMRRRATAIFGEGDTVEKEQFVKQKMEIALSGQVKVSNENSPISSDKGVSNITDLEILNIIALSLKKLDVARKLEIELNEEMTKLREKEVEQKPTKKRKLTTK